MSMTWKAISGRPYRSFMDTKVLIFSIATDPEAPAQAAGPEASAEAAAGDISCPSHSSLAVTSSLITSASAAPGPDDTAAAVPASSPAPAAAAPAAAAPAAAAPAAAACPAAAAAAGATAPGAASTGWGPATPSPGFTPGLPRVGRVDATDGPSSKRLLLAGRAPSGGASA